MIEDEPCIMQKLALHALLLFTLLTLMLACDSGPYSDAGEPNDSILEADRLISGKPIRMRIDSGDDVDWYGIPLDSNGYLKIGYQKLPEGMVLEARFAKKQAWEAKKRKWLGEWQKLPLAQAFRGLDTVHFAVRSKKGNNSPKKFRLRAEFLPEMDEYEPNNSKGEARSISLGETIRTFAYPKGDRDYFKVEVDGGGYLYANAKNVPEGIGAELRFLKKERGQGRLIPISGYRTLPAGASVSESGTYYIEFGDDHNDAASREPVEWELERVPQMDSTEPNARWSDAQAIDIGNTLELALFPAGDRDLLRIDPSRDLNLKVIPEGVEGVAPQIQTVQDDEGTHKDKSGWRGLPATFSLDAGKTHYLILREKKDDGGDRRPFRLSFEEGKEAPS